MNHCSNDNDDEIHDAIMGLVMKLSAFLAEEYDRYRDMEILISALLSTVVNLMVTNGKQNGAEDFKSMLTASVAALINKGFTMLENWERLKPIPLDAQNYTREQ